MKSDLSDLAGERSRSGLWKPGKTGLRWWGMVAVTDMSSGVSESLPPSSPSSVSWWERAFQWSDFLVRSTAASRLTDWEGIGTMGRYRTPGSIIALKQKTTLRLGGSEISAKSEGNIGRSCEVGSGRTGFSRDKDRESVFRQHFTPVGFSVAARATGGAAPALSDLGGTGEITRQHRHRQRGEERRGEEREPERVHQSGQQTPQISGRTHFLIHFMMEIKFLRPPAPLTPHHQNCCKLISV